MLGINSRSEYDLSWDILVQLNTMVDIVRQAGSIGILSSSSFHGCHTKAVILHSFPANGNSFFKIRLSEDTSSLVGGAKQINCISRDITQFD